METVNLFKLFNISIETEDKDLEESYKKLRQKLVSNSEKSELLENFNLISTKEKRYLYLLTSTKGFQEISDLDKEIISQPNYIGPGHWLKLL
ncbi:MAG: hypothetical protein PF693_01300 [Spirochaetia bacterium]|nr:hypothetical protein [Spirochaetia bacterium]